MRRVAIVVGMGWLGAAVGCAMSPPRPLPPTAAQISRWVDVNGIQLGDSFDEVAQRITLSRDPNGHIQGAELDEQEKTEWSSTSGPLIILESGQRYAPICLVTFDSKRRL